MPAEPVEDIEPEAEPAIVLPEAFLAYYNQTGALVNHLTRALDELKVSNDQLKAELKAELKAGNDQLKAELMAGNDQLKAELKAYDAERAIW